jgi:energy-coupling factor transport system permease protein
VIANRMTVADAALDSPLGRASPVGKLVIALAWLLVCGFNYDPRPALVIAIASLAAGLAWGHVPPRRLAFALLPLWSAALGITLFNSLFSAANLDPAAHPLLLAGPLRLTAEGLAGGVGMGMRVIAIAAVGVVFAQTTDSTRLVDSLVQQGRVPERFAYGALAAYQAVPRLGAQLGTLMAARRIRGLRGVHLGLVIGLLVLAIRHGDRLALAMDARGFGTGPRSRYRELRWSLLDGVVAGGAAAVAVVAILAGR